MAPLQAQRGKIILAKNRKAEVDAAAAGFDFAKNNYQLVLDTNQGKITLNMLPDVAPGPSSRA